MKRQVVHYSTFFIFVVVLLLSGCIVQPDANIEKATILAPVLIRPVNDAVILDSTPKLEWYVVSGVSVYTVEVKNALDNSIVGKAHYKAEVRCDSEICSIPSPVELSPGEYKWHVVGWIGDIRGEYSKYYMFTVVDE